MLPLPPTPLAEVMAEPVVLLVAPPVPAAPPVEPLPEPDVLLTVPPIPPLPPAPPVELLLDAVVVLDPPSAPASNEGAQAPAWQVPIEHVAPLGFAGFEHTPVPSWQVPTSWH